MRGIFIGFAHLRLTAVRQAHYAFQVPFFMVPEAGLEPAQP